MPTLYKIQSLALFLATTLAHPAFSQDDLFDASLEDLLSTEVVGVSKTKQLISEAPANVSVITAEDINRYGYLTIAEAISRLPGIAITRDNTYSYGGVRGMTSDAANYNSRFLLMINGHRINDGLYDQALIGNESIIDINTIDRIEFIKGPGAIMYGGNALYGVINILTRSGRQVDGMELRAAVGSSEGYSVSQISGGETDAGTQWLAQVSHTEDAKHDQSNRYGDYSGRGRHTKAMGQLKGDNFNVTMMFAEHQLQNSEVWTYQGDYYVSDIPETTRQLMLGGEYTWQVGHKTHLTALGNISRFHDDFSRYDFGELWYRDVSNSDWISGELRLGSEAIEGQRWTMGIEWRRDLPLDNKYWYEPLENPADVYFLDVDRTSVGGYIQGEVSLATDWTIVAGGRIDKIEYFDAEFSPRVSLIWTPTAASTFKLIHSEAFRTPSAIELSYGQDINDYGDLVTPERMQSQELVYEYRKGGVFAGVSVYYNQLKNAIVEDSMAAYVNDKDLTSQGIELSTKYHHKSGLGGYANYSYQDTSSDTETPVMNSPENLLKAGVDGAWFENRFTTALEWQYTSEREVASESEKAEAYHLVNLYMTARPWSKGPELSFKALNIMDEEYGVSAYSFEFPGRGRELWFGVTQTW